MHFRLLCRDGGKIRAAGRLVARLGDLLRGDDKAGRPEEPREAPGQPLRCGIREPASRLIQRLALGTKAGDGNDRIIYDQDNGVIRYDADGTGKLKAQIVAILDGAPTLTNVDFFVI